MSELVTFTIILGCMILMLFMSWFIFYYRWPVQYKVGDVLIEYDGPKVDLWELEDCRYYVVKQLGVKRVLVDVYRNKEAFDRKLLKVTNDYSYKILRYSTIRLKA